MSDVTVKQLAEVVGTPVDRLLEQLQDAGLSKGGADDAVTDNEKMELLEFLRRSHGRNDGAPLASQKITLRRKRVSELKVSAGAPGRRTVNVEVRGKRTYVKRSAALQDEVKKSQELEEERVRQETEAAELERKRLEAEQSKRQEEERKRKELEEEAKRKAVEEEEARRKAEEEGARRKAEEEAKAKSAADEKSSASERKRKEKETRYGRDEIHVAKGKAGRRSKKRTVRVASKTVESKHGFEKPTAPVVREVNVPDTITVAELANAMAVKAAEVIKAMMNMGEMATINQVIDQDTAVLVVEEMGHRAVTQSESDMEKSLTEVLHVEISAEEASPRPPVVTVMGHVDHGKTSLLDHIRRTRVTAGEAGGITQHIGAYHVETNRGMITFLDTPGHAAFTAMRARGAHSTDIVVLVVAADDGVKPQTVEAIQHARAAQVPLVIAVNKMDKPEADPERVRSELAQQDVIPDAWGGDTQFINVSAQSGEGIDALLDAILLQAELLELRAPRGGYAAGVVVEATLDKGRGPVATVLVQSGTLHKGDIVVTGTEFGRVRALFDEAGNAIASAGPSIPAVVLGLSGTPNAGDELLATSDERKAKELAQYRQSKTRDLRLASQRPAKLEDVFSQIREGEVQVLNVMVKTDVQGSFEALRESLEKLSNDEVQVKIIGGGVGGITESDVNLAAASQAIVIGFNVRADSTARRVVAEQGVDLRYFSVIYEAIDQVKAAIGGMLSPEIQERIIGLAEVKEVFKSPKMGAVAGSIVVDGVVRKREPIRVLRDNVVIYEGELESLRRFKDDVEEVRMGTECGIAVRNYNDVRVGDHIEVYERTEVARTVA
ncbi:MAG: translation initiation factor IF-2 [Gammaproteobacteria bacterium]|nr:translation initiation factor IF-2 [Gammaproteobacteria bacterium]